MTGMKAIKCDYFDMKFKCFWQREAEGVKWSEPDPECWPRGAFTFSALSQLSPCAIQLVTVWTHSTAHDPAGDSGVSLITPRTK